MLYSTTMQIWVILGLFLFGLWGGVFWSAKKLFFKSIEKNKILKFLIDLFFTVFIGFIFVYGVYRYNFGQFRPYLAVIFVFGIIVEQFSIGDIIAKLLNFLYNLLVALFKKLQHKFFNFRQKRKEKIADRKRV